ncbi:MAG: tetratricopeptide repeat protein [Pseudomonadota bacterium]
MSYTAKHTFGLAGIAALGLCLGAPLAAQNAPSGEVSEDADLAADTLSEGQTAAAITMLEAELEQAPGDPALLINLGIAHAQTGNAGEARANFEAAMRSRTVVELETANGTTTDSRRLARRALSMLERGAFRQESSSQLTLRD